MKRHKIAAFVVLACATGYLGCHSSKRPSAATPEAPSPAQERLDEPASQGPADSLAPPASSPANAPAKTPAKTHALEEGSATEGEAGAKFPQKSSSDSIESGGHGVRQSGEARVETDEALAVNFSRDLQTLDDRLRDFAANELANCGRACDLAAQICALKDSICRLTEQSSARAVAERCVDAVARCARARRETEQRCACGER